MRTNNSIRNIKVAVLGQFINIFLSFFVRTILIRELGKEYLGLLGLFNNILLILSLAELGFANAIYYSLYKPLAQNDQYKITAILNFYKKAYRIIGIVVFICGGILIPFLPIIITNTPDIGNISMMYTLVLMNSVSSYFFSYKSALTFTDQKKYINVFITYSYTIGINILQIILLIQTKNFYIYLSLQIICTVLKNLTISHYVNKHYPYILNKEINLERKERKAIIDNIKSILFYRIGGVVIAGTDNIVISTFISIGLVGLYSNYLLIISSVNAMLVNIFQAITASVGNLNAIEDDKKKYHIYKVLCFASFWAYGFCSIALLLMINPFIKIWIGNEYVLKSNTVIIIVANFYLAGMMRNISEIFINTLGLFKHVHYYPFISAILNLVISIVMVKRIGLKGVFLGTFISFLFTYFWAWPYVVFKKGFKHKLFDYFYSYFKYSISVIIALVTTWSVIIFIDVNSFTVRLIACTIIPNLVFVVLYFRTKAFLYYRNILWDKMRLIF